MLTLTLAALFHGPRLLEKPLAPGTITNLVIALLMLYLVACLPLYDAAHSGGVLVHGLGVHAKL